MFLRKPVKRHHVFPIPYQSLCRPGEVFFLAPFDKPVTLIFRFLTGLGISNALQFTLCILLGLFRQFIQYVNYLVVSAPLYQSFGIHLIQSTPDAQVTVSRDQPRTIQSSLFHVPQIFNPALYRLPVAGFYG